MLHLVSNTLKPSVCHLVFLITGAVLIVNVLLIESTSSIFLPGNLKLF